MTTQRAIRRLRPDPVDDEVILRILRLAVKAPTGSNMQGWEFIVVRDPKVKAALGKQNRRIATPYLKAGRIVRRKDPKAQRLIDATEWQAKHWDEIPVIVIPCLRGISWPLPWIYKSSRYGSIYPAIQNLLLAARAEGLGAALTTFALWNRVAARRILKLPFNVEPIAVIPMGWPIGRYGPTTRKPVETITHLDRYGNLAFKP
ncbi:MAG: nitroreductase family protein [Actinomycetota bacterium]